MCVSPQLPDISVTAIPADAFLLDVREADEWRAGHAESAVHVPLGAVTARVGDLPSDATIVCICRLGGRSAKAAEFLGAHGFTAVSLDGGMKAWADAGLPMVSDSGAPPQVI